jgi:hypothetical protein
MDCRAFARRRVRWIDDLPMATARSRVKPGNDD